jgi:hypothetical protein
VIFPGNKGNPGMKMRKNTIGITYLKASISTSSNRRFILQAGLSISDF